MDRLLQDARCFEDELASIFREYPEIVAAYLFGSVARGENSELSDFDLGLVLASRERRDEAHRFLGDLAAQLEGVAAPAPVDVVILGDQGPVFCHEVLLEGRLVYESDREARVRFEVDTIVRALDFRPTLEIATKGYVPAFRRWLRSYRERERHPAAT